jgi:hypothetical protein
MNDEAKLMQPAPQAAAVPATTTLNQNTTLNFGDDRSYLAGEAADARRHMQSGARWFYWIAGLSLINAIAAAANSTWSFLAGLGITQFISGFAAALSTDLSDSGAVLIVAFVFNVLVAGFFVFLGVFAQKGHSWAFIVGFVVYALDALIFLAVQLWFPLAFHVFVFYCLYKGFAANQKLHRLEAEMATTST